MGGVINWLLACQPGNGRVMHQSFVTTVPSPGFRFLHCKTLPKSPQCGKTTAVSPMQFIFSLYCLSCLYNPSTLYFPLTAVTMQKQKPQLPPGTGGGTNDKCTSAFWFRSCSQIRLPLGLAHFFLKNCCH